MFSKRVHFQEDQFSRDYEDLIYTPQGRACIKSALVIHNSTLLVQHITD
jgi:hypothetical protein